MQHFCGTYWSNTKPTKTVPTIWKKLFKFNMIEFKPNELEVDVGVRSVQNDEHLAELGKVTKQFIARMEGGN